MLIRVIGGYCKIEYMVFNAYNFNVDFFQNGNWTLKDNTLIHIFCKIFNVSLCLYPKKWFLNEPSVQDMILWWCLVIQWNVQSKCKFVKEHGGILYTTSQNNFNLLCPSRIRIVAYLYFLYNYYRLKIWHFEHSSFYVFILC